jgi:hypothetical protein
MNGGCGGITALVRRLWLVGFWMLLTVQIFGTWRGDAVLGLVIDGDSGLGAENLWKSLRPTPRQSLLTLDRRRRMIIAGGGQSHGCMYGPSAVAVW